MLYFIKNWCMHACKPKMMNQTNIKSVTFANSMEIHEIRCDASNASQAKSIDWDFTMGSFSATINSKLPLKALKNAFVGSDPQTAVLIHGSYGADLPLALVSATEMSDSSDDEENHGCED